MIVKKWLGREDSNLRMQEPKSCVLPLDDAPAEKKLSTINLVDLRKAII